MKEFRLIISPLAEVDMEVAIDWYQLQKENIGNDFLKQIDNTFSNKKKPSSIFNFTKAYSKSECQTFSFFNLLHSSKTNHYCFCSLS